MAKYKLKRKGGNDKRSKSRSLNLNTLETTWSFSCKHNNINGESGITQFCSYVYFICGADQKPHHAQSQSPCASKKGLQSASQDLYCLLLYYLYVDDWKIAAVVVAAAAVDTKPEVCQSLSPVLHAPLRTASDALETNIWYNSQTLQSYNKIYIGSGVCIRLKQYFFFTK